MKPTWIGHALKRRPCWKGQTSLVPSVFYMLPFHAYLKRKPFRRINFFSPQKKIPPALRGHKLKILAISKKQGMKLEIFINFLKKRHFLHFKTMIIFFGFILQFWRSVILLSQTLHLFFQVALCNKSSIRQGPSNHTPLLYELLASVL